MRLSVAGLKHGEDIFRNVANLLKIVPCIHFLKRGSKSSQTVALSLLSQLRSILRREVGYVVICMRMCRNYGELCFFCRFIRATLDELKPMFKVDSWFPLVLSSICPLRDLPLLCDYVHLNLVIDRITDGLADLWPEKVTVLSSKQLNHNSNSYWFILSRWKYSL